MKVTSAINVCNNAPLAYHSSMQEQCLVHKVMAARSGSAQLICIVGVA